MVISSLIFRGFNESLLEIDSEEVEPEAVAVIPLLFGVDDDDGVAFGLAATLLLADVAGAFLSMSFLATILCAEYT